MALTLRTNGSGTANLVGAQWFNDYYDLLTGLMTDQIVTFETDVILESILSGTIAAPVLSLNTGTALGIGSYGYFITYVDASGGETSQAYGTVAHMTTTSGNQGIALSSIPTGPTGTVKRRIYRTKVGGSTYYLLATLNDNTTTTYTDTTADTSLVTAAPAHPSFGGSLSIKNNSGAIKGQIFNDGAISFDSGNIFSSGTGVLNVSNQINWGPGISGQFSYLYNDTASHVTTLGTPVAGGSAQGIAFNTWNGSASVIPFSVGGQYYSAPTYVDNSGNLTVGGNLYEGSGGTGTSYLGGGDIALYSARGAYTWVMASNYQPAGQSIAGLLQAWSGSGMVSILGLGGNSGGACVAYIDYSGNMYATSYNGPIHIDVESSQTVIRPTPTSDNIIIQVNGNNATFGTDGSLSLAGKLVTGEFVSMNIPVTGNNWWDCITYAPSAATVNHSWSFVYDGSTGNTFLYDNTSGDIPWSGHTDGSFWFGTYRNGGVTTQVPIYTGTNTPTGSPPTGAIWIKA